MSRIDRDGEREKRIDYEIVVDAYNEEERAMGWYYYLDDNISFPFAAKWLDDNTEKGIQVKVLEMSSDEDCLDDMFVEIEYQDDIFSARLSDIEPLQVGEETIQAITDWKYWVNRGYEF